MTIYLDFLDIILGSSLMLQLMTLGLVHYRHSNRSSKWLILSAVITLISLFATNIADPMFQSAFAGAMFTGSLIVFFAAR